MNRVLKDEKKLLMGRRIEGVSKLKHGGRKVWVGGGVIGVEGKASKEEWGFGWSYTQKGVSTKQGTACGFESYFWWSVEAG